MRPSTRSVVLNSALLMPLVIGLAVAAASLALEFLSSLSVKARTVVPTAFIGNFVAPVLVGFAVCFVLHCVRWRRKPCPAAHWLQFAAFYVIATLLLVLIVVGSQSPDFWMIGQMFLWPCLALWAGICGDLVAVWWRRQYTTTLPESRAT